MAYYSLKADFFVSPEGVARERERRPLRRSVARTIYERDGQHCALCGAPVRRGGQYDTPFDRGTNRCGSIDHILPVSRGGDHSPTNLRVACKTCNCSRKADI